MNRPVIFGETIGKKTSSQNKTSITYERGMLTQEDRIFVEAATKDIKGATKLTGYDGTPVIKEVFNFEETYPGLTFKDPNLLYDRMMNDARNVFPRNRDLKTKVNAYYTQAIQINLNNIYHNAPRFFSDNFIPQTRVNNAAFESYQVYIYLLCFINYTDEHRNDVEVREMDNIDAIFAWIATRRDPSIKYIIQGPPSNSSLQQTDFRSHYRTLIDASNDMTSILAYNQLSSTQTISADLYRLADFFANMPNVYHKTPDEARKYNINIDTSRGVMVTIDNNMNLVFDCSYINLGDVTEQNKLAKFENLESVITNNKVNSMINTKKLAELFHNYSRIKILELVITPDTYISALDAFAKVFVVFRGVSCSERNVYNTIETNFLKIGGKFVKTNRGYEFRQDVDAITYKSVLADVKSFEIFLTLDPSVTNKIVPNEYALTIQKDKIYNHPITTDVVYDAKVRGQKKLLTVVEEVTDDEIRGSETTSTNFWKTPDIGELLPEIKKAGSNVEVVNDVATSSTNWVSQIKNNKHMLTVSEVLYDRWGKNTNLNEVLDFIWNLRKLYNCAHIQRLIDKLIKFINKARMSKTIGDDVQSALVALAVGSELTSEQTDLITTAIAEKYELYSSTDCGTILRVLNDLPRWTSEIANAAAANLQASTPLTTEQHEYVNQLVYSLPALSWIEKHNMLNRLNADDAAYICDVINKSKLLDESERATLIDKLNMKQNNVTYTDDEKSYINKLVKSDNPITPDEITLIITALEPFKDEPNYATTVEALSTGVGSISRGLIDDALSAFIDMTANKPAILSDINSAAESWSSGLFEDMVTDIVNRSLFINEDDKRAYLQLTASPKLIAASSYATDIIGIIENDPKYEIDTTHLDAFGSIDIDAICKKSDTYKSAKVLFDSPGSNIAQTEAILRSYEAETSNSYTINITDVIYFITVLSKSKLFTYSQRKDLDVFYVYVNQNADRLENFFNSVTTTLTDFTSDISELVNAYIKLLDNVSYITFDYDAYFIPIFDAMTSIPVNDVFQLCVVLKSFINTYNILYNQLGMNKNYKHNENGGKNFIYKTVEVDTRTATIGGQYFTVDGSGFAWLGANEPDPNYLIYTEDENDLTLFNLYRKFADVIKPINTPSFIYSETLGTIQNLPYKLTDYTHVQNKFKFDNGYVSNETGQMFYEYHDTTNKNVINTPSYSFEMSWGDSVNVSNNTTFVSKPLKMVKIIPTVAPSDGNNTYNVPFTISASMGVNSFEGTGTCNFYNNHLYGVIKTANVSDVIGCVVEADYAPSSSPTFSSVVLENSTSGYGASSIITDKRHQIIEIDNKFGLTFINDENINITEIVRLGTLENGAYVYNFPNRSGMIPITYIYDPANALFTVKTTNKIDETNSIERYNSIQINLNNNSVYQIDSVSNPTTGATFTYTKLISFEDDTGHVYTVNDILTPVRDYSSENNEAESNLYKAYHIDDLDPKCDYWNRTAYIASLMLCPLESCFENYVSPYEWQPVTNEKTYRETDINTVYVYAPKFKVYTDTIKVTLQDILIEVDNKFESSGLKHLFVNSNESINYFYNGRSIDTPYVLKLEPSRPRVEFDNLELPLYNSESSTNNISYYIRFIFDPNGIVGFKVIEPRTRNVVAEYSNHVQSAIPCYVTFENQEFETVITYTVTEDFASPPTNTFTIQSVSFSTVRYNSTQYRKTGNGVEYRQFETIKFSNMPSKYAAKSDVLFSLTGDYDTKFKFHPVFKYAEKCFVAPRFVDSNNQFVMIAEKYNQNVMTKPVYLRSQYDLNSTTHNTIRDPTDVIYKIFPVSDTNKTHLLESINKNLLMIGSVTNTGTMKDVAITAAFVNAIPSSSKMMISLEFS